MGCLSCQHSLTPSRETSLHLYCDRSDRNIYWLSPFLQLSTKHWGSTSRATCQQKRSFYVQDRRVRASRKLDSTWNSYRESLGFSSRFPPSSFPREACRCCTTHFPSYSFGLGSCYLCYLTPWLWSLTLLSTGYICSTWASCCSYIEYCSTVPLLGVGPNADSVLHTQTYVPSHFTQC